MEMESGGCSNSRNTCHQGFDYWRGEFSGKVQEIETALHVTSQQDTRYTDKLLREATSMLPHLLQEAESVSERKDPALRQEMLDIFLACKMQLETYLLLNEQRHLFSPSCQQQSHSNNDIRIDTSSRQQFKTPTSTSALWDTITPNQVQSSSINGHHTTTGSRRNQIHATTQGRVMNQNSRLRDALRSFKESEEVAHQISEELQGQRKSLERTQSSVNSLSDLTLQAKGLLKSMNKKWWMKW
jgi:hypothetical protein